MLLKRILFASAATLLVCGGAVTMVQRDASASTTQLVRGWNNVAYLGETGAPAVALTEISGKYEAVYRWDAAVQQYKVFGPGLPAFANTLTTITKGDSIWVSLTAQSAQLSPSTSGGGATGPGRIAIAASAFLPANDLAVYEKTFNQLNPVGIDVESQRYYAPVILPEGATVTSMTAAFEAASGQVQVRLDYTPLGNGSNTAQIFKLVEVLSSGGASPQTQSAYAHTVDNGTNVYFLVVDLTGGIGSKLKGVSIAYTVN